jgi:hypothetical protein
VRLKLHREQALLCQRLSQIALDAPLDGAGDFTRGRVDAATLLSLCESVGFGPLTRRRLHEAAGIEFAPA